MLGRLHAVAPPPADSTLHGPAGLSVEIRRSGARPVVVVAGELDLSGRDLLEALLGHVRAGSRQPVAVDLAQVPFADTHGLEPVLEPDVVVVAASPAVTRLLRHLEILTGRPLTPRRARARDRAAAVWR